MSDDLVSWLRLQLDEDERIAKIVAARYVERGPYAENPGKLYWPLPSVVARFEIDSDPDIYAGLTLIRMFDPSRVLREVEALRRIVELHAPKDGYSPPDGWYGNENKCQTCGGYTLSPGFGDRGYRTSWPCPTLRLLAAIFSDHPGYREEWRPDSS